MNIRIVLTIFVCNDNDRFTPVTTPRGSRCKHCDAVVGKFFQSCQSSISFWSNHYHLICWTTIRQLCVGDCIVHYNAILIVCWNFIPLYKNAGRGFIVSSDIIWGSIWYYNNKKNTNVTTAQKNHSIGLGRVFATRMYSSTELVEFPKFQTGIFVRWKAPYVCSFKK